MLRERQKSSLRIKGLGENGEWNINIKNCVWPPQNNTLTKRVVKGIFITRDWPFFFSWNVKWLIFSPWIVIFIVAVKSDLQNYFPWNKKQRFISPWTVIFIMFDNCYYVINDFAWPWCHDWALLRQCGWSGFQWTLDSHHFPPLFRLFRP